jgi:alpha-amylase/alpha-mannosidase (GH57 family)
MKKLKVAFLWHMHQPYYLDELKHEFIMPWVRLHSTRGYYDMIKILENYNKIKLNFNLVPALLLQIEKYKDPSNKDKYYELTIKNPSDLTYDEKLFLLSKFFMINQSTVISKSSRYDELLYKRGYQVNKNILREAINIYTKQDFMDLQVWFNLGWFGFTAIKEEPFLQELIKKGRDFTQDEKEQLLNIQLKILNKIIPIYKKFFEEGKIEISFSPFYHPILPLLYNNKIALECMPNVKLPDKIFSYPEDAKIQVKKAKDYFQRIFNKESKGIWPSEGSVSNDVLNIFAKNKIKWFATDEEILFHTLGSCPDRAKTLYKPYKIETSEGEVFGFFRDHILSDNIGFKYSKMKGKDAAEDLYHHLKNIYEHIKNDDKDYIVSIILDGENAWEYYYDSGEEFLNTLYSKIENDEHLESITLSEYLEKYKNFGTLNRIYPGSWISHNFAIWIGGEEENKAWVYLKNTKDFLVEFIRNNPDFDKNKIEQANEEIYQAEGSDWFWWYGDKFSSINDEEFDALFRQHLKNVYIVLGLNPPEELNIPIKEKAKTSNILQPTFVLNPIIDGIVNNYFEWYGAVRYKPELGAAMAQTTKRIIKQFFYAYNGSELFFRFDLVNIDEILKEELYKIRISFVRPERNRIIFDLKKDTDEYFFIMPKSEKKVGSFNKIKIDRIIELSIPFEKINLEYESNVYFFVEVLEKDKVIETHPFDGYIYFKMPPKNFESLMWLKP